MQVTKGQVEQVIAFRIPCGFRAAILSILTGVITGLLVFVAIKH